MCVVCFLAVNIMISYFDLTLELLFYCLLYAILTNSLL